MHFYQYNISDFNNSARHLTLVERALYRDLIDMYYDTENAIDASDFERLARRLMCRTDEEKESLRYVLSEFFEFKDGLYVNDRCEEEIAHYKKALEDKIKAGKVSANSRISKNRQKNQQQSNAEPTQVEQESNTTITPIEQPLSTCSTGVEQPLSTCSTGVEQPLNECSTNYELRTKNYELNNTPLTPLGELPDKPDKKPKRQNGTRLSADFVMPDEWLTWAKQENPSLTDASLRLIADKFKDYWISVAGAKGAKLDWFATWRNWVRSDFNKPITDKNRNGAIEIPRHFSDPNRDYTEGTYLREDGSRGF